MKQLLSIIILLYFAVGQSGYVVRLYRNMIAISLPVMNWRAPLQIGLHVALRLLVTIKSNLICLHKGEACDLSIS